MHVTPLQDTGISVSRLTLGCWSFGGDEQSYWGKQEQEEVEAIVSQALERGVTTFDTAFAYNDGASERALGTALRGRREKAVICNKIPVHSFEQLARFEGDVQDSLTRLGTDYVDVLMLHWPAQDEALLRANLEALLRVKAMGMTRAIGVSNFGVRTLEIAGEMGVPVVLNEFAYNLMSRGIERSVLPLCEAQGIGIAAYMPLMQGILTGKYEALSDIPAIRRRSIHFDNAGNPLARHGGKGAEAEVEELLVVLCQLAWRMAVPAGRLALAWLAAKKGVYTSIVGCRTVEQLMQNLIAMETVLEPQVSEALEQASTPIDQALGGNMDLWQLDRDSRIW